MELNLYPFLVSIIFKLILIIPFGISLFYVFMGWKQIKIAGKEKNTSKMNGGVTSLIIAMLFVTAIILLWLF